MSDVLSQAEIDALLSALSTGEVDADKMKSDEQTKKVKVYDFKRPDKFSKDQIRTLQMLHDSFARYLTTALSTQLRMMVQIDVVSVEQITYEEFVRSIPSTTTLAIFDMPPLDGNGIVEIGTSITFSIIDRLLGGPGMPPEKVREVLTDIETIIIGKVLHKLLDCLKQAWQNVGDININLKSIETNPQFVQIVPASDMVALITFNMVIGSLEGMMSVCLPYIVLEPIVPKLSAHYWFSSSKKEQTGDNMLALKYKLEKTKVPVVVELANTSLAVGEVLRLQRGDVIPLHVALDKEMDIRVGTKVKFKSRPGVMGKRMAVQVTSIVEEGEDENG